MKKNRGRARRNRQEIRKKAKGTVLLIIAGVLAIVLLLGAGALLALREAPQSTAAVGLAPERVLNSDVAVATAPPIVRQAYRFAIANPELLSTIPCYCGCGGVGHQSNLDCFVKGLGADGSAIFDHHALGWGICVDIARDVMQMLERGRGLAEIRGAINREYSQYGLPTTPGTAP